MPESLHPMSIERQVASNLRLGHRKHRPLKRTMLVTPLHPMFPLRQVARNLRISHERISDHTSSNIPPPMPTRDKWQEI